MKREDLLLFEGKIVKIVLDTGFVLLGTITQVNDDNILFTTDQATSLIRIDTIRQIVEKNNRW